MIFGYIRLSRFIYNILLNSFYAKSTKNREIQDYNFYINLYQRPFHIVVFVKKLTDEEKIAKETDRKIKNA